MASIITDQIRILNAKNFVAGVNNSSNAYYSFVGLPNPADYQSTWDSDPPSPKDNFTEEDDYWDTMIALKKINSADAKQVVPKRTWSSGTTYDMYRHDYSRSNTAVVSGSTSLYLANYFVLNSDFRVYICLQNGIDPDNPSTGSKLFQNGSDQMVTMCQGGYKRNKMNAAMWSTSSVTDMNDLSPSLSIYNDDAHFGSNSYVEPMALVYLDNNGYVQGIYNRNTNNEHYNRYPFWRVTFPAPGSPARVDNYLDNAIKQFIGGAGGDAGGGGGYGIYLSTSDNNDHTHRIDTYTASSNSVSTLHNFTTTHSGGSRTVPGTMGRATKISSRHFAITGGRGWYTPFFDTSGNYIPWWFEWNTSTDTFTRSETTIAGTSSTSAGLTGNNNVVSDAQARRSSG